MGFIYSPFTVGAERKDLEEKLVEEEEDDDEDDARYLNLEGGEDGEYP